MNENTFIGDKNSNMKQKMNERNNLKGIKNNNTRTSNNVNKNIITIYENLPTGGAKFLYTSNINYLKQKYRLNLISDKKYSTKILNLLQYLKYIIFDSFLIEKRLLNELRQSKIFVAYHSWVTKSTRLLRQKDVPEIYICHEVPREFYDKAYIKSFTFKEKVINILRIFVKNIDKINVEKNKKLVIVSNSNFSAKNILDVYGKSSTVIYPGIKIKEFGKYQPIDKRISQLICVGSINKLKNQKEIINIVSKLKTKKLVRLMLIGNGGDINYIKQLKLLAIKNDVNLSIRTNVSRVNLIKEYKKSKIFLFNPMNEPFGIVVLEALRCGLPVILGNDGGGYNEIITEKNGYLIPPNSIDKWVNTINKLLVNDSLWEKISRYNYEYSSKFSDKNMNREMYRLIDKILNKKV